MRKRNNGEWRLPVPIGSLKAHLGRRIHNISLPQRITCAAIAGVVLLAIITPTAWQLVSEHRYRLDTATLKLVGAVNPGLAAKLSYDSQDSQWQFNKSGSVPSHETKDQNEAVASMLKAQTGGAGKNDESLYAVNFPKDPKKGVRFFDSQTQLSFTMVPQFDVDEGQATNGRLVYPMKQGVKLVYTAKNNGMKEDIILPKFIEKEIQFSYKLELPTTLKAQIQSDGSVGIFSADPILFGNVSTNTDMDAEKLKSAREQGEKTHLLFAIPAPTIIQSGDSPPKASARFGLAGSILTLTARDMDKVRYPVSVDPSVVVTSTSEFKSGNNEDNIYFSTDQVNRAHLTGGSIGAWNTSSGTGLTARFAVGSAIYNDYMYISGGNSSSDMYYAPITSTTGVIGNWSKVSTVPGGARVYPGMVAYNGYMYIYGGAISGSTTASDDVMYAPINSDGTLGTWSTSTNAMAMAVCRAGNTVYNGYLYAVGGATGTTVSSCGNTSATNVGSVQYAPLLANGDVGQWNVSSHTITARKDVGVAAYNGYLYALSGTTNGTTTFSTVQYAKINSDGNIGAWITSATTTLGDYRFRISAYNGYLYINGGTNSGTKTRHALIKSNGDIDDFVATTSMTDSRWGHAFGAYNGYLYYAAGTGAAVYGDSASAKIDPSGVTSGSTSTTAFGSTVDSGTAGAGFMYNGYLYYAGGYNGSDYSRQVRYATINANGTVGAWALTSALQIPITGGSGIGGQSYAVYNNRVYMIGGTTTTAGGTANVNTIQYASFNANGTLSAWTFNPTNYVNGVANQAATAYNGIIYMIGFSGGGATNRIYRAPINSDGTLGAWVWDGSGTNPAVESVAFASMLTYNKFLYIVGGRNGSSYKNNVQYAPINSDGSLGAWASTSPLSVARNVLNVAILNGHMYAIGGETASSTYSSVVEYTRINDDGTVEPWSTGTNLTATYAAGGVATWNDNIYLISGRNNGTRAKTVTFIKTRSGGGGATSSWSTSGNTFSTGRSHHGTFVSNNYLYVLGGMDSGGSYLNDVQYAKLGDDGSVGTWTAATSLPSGRGNMGVIAYGNYAYVFGGKTNATAATNTAYSAHINSNGTLDAWNTSTNLPNNLYDMATITRNGYAYLLGGTNTNSSNNVLYAKLNNDGTSGAWESTTGFSEARSNAGAAVNGNYLYILGGINGSGNYLKDVQYAQLNSSDGTLGQWTTTTDLNYARAYISPTSLNGFLYVYGGYDGNNSYNKVDYAPFNPNGSIGAWTSGAPFTTARYGQQVDTNNGYAYLTGGNSGSMQNTVQVSAVQSSPRTATYSKLFDLGASYNISEISYGGRLPHGRSALTYKTADENGVFGTSSYANQLDPNNVTCTSGSARYVFVIATIDDSTWAAHADVISDESYLSHLAVSYVQFRAETDKRLAHGKHFRDEVLQPLDTCSSS